MRTHVKDVVGREVSWMDGTQNRDWWNNVYLDFVAWVTGKRLQHVQLSRWRALLECGRVIGYDPTACEEPAVVVRQLRRHRRNAQPTWETRGGAHAAEVWCVDAQKWLDVWHTSAPWRKRSTGVLLRGAGSCLGRREG